MQYLDRSVAWDECVERRRGAGGVGWDRGGSGQADLGLEIPLVHGFGHV